MKKLHLVATRFLVLNLMFFSTLASAQTPEQAKKITASYDQAYLRDLAAKSLEESTKKKKAAIEFAKARNIPVAYTTKEGSYVELQEVLPDGTLLYNTTYNADAANSTRTNHLNIGGSTGYNLEGQNMTAYVWDGGHPRATHQEYDGPGGTNRFSIMDSSEEGGLQLNSHAAHVAGTIGASGVEPQAKGMAPRSNVKAYKWNDDLAEATTEAANGMLISNHSYGTYAQNVSDDRLFGSYQYLSRVWDNLMFNAPYYLMVVAAGNDGNNTHFNGHPLAPGYDMLTNRQTAKNNLIVANSQDAVIDSNGNLVSVAITSSSSQGPTDDLRIKPDISGNGYFVYSTVETSNNAYDTKTGTSMASPNVAGSLLLLQEHYNKVNSNFMKAATLKGLALHTADDAGPVGPDARFGWGLLNSKRAAETITQNGTSALMYEMLISQGQTITLQVDADGVNDLIASVSWTDRQGEINNILNSPTPTLVNDLDIRVSKNGTTFYPWRLTSATTNSNSGDNHVDPFERIEVANASGTYTVTISHKGTLVGGSQAFSLIVTGIQVDCSTASVPQAVNTLEVQGETATIAWTPIPGATYDLRYREAGVSTWTSVSDITSNTYEITGLNTFTEYEVEVRSKCVSGTPSNYSNTLNFTTAGLDYCASFSSSARSDYHISNVTLNTINNTSTESTYSDFTNISTTLTAGETYTIALTTGADANYRTYYNVWIDYNNNGVFNTSERVFTTQGVANNVASGSFTVPSDVNPSTTTMRVILSYSAISNPCGEISLGEVEDYAINLQTAEPCIAQTPQNVSASNINDDSATVTWTLIPEMTYDLRYREVATSTWSDVLDISTNSYEVSGLNPETEYEVEVRSKCLDGTPSDYSTAISFTTTTMVVTYCDSSSSVARGDYYLSNVTLNTINNTSAESTYSDFTNISTELTAGEAYTISLTPSADGNYWTSYGVWIDYNNNGVFDAAEKVFEYTGGSVEVATGSIIIPADSNPLSTTMRVSMTSGQTVPGPCDSIVNGEVEDYTIVLLEATCTALVPQDVAVTNVAEETATVTWTSITEMTYDLRYREVASSTWSDVLDIATNTYDVTGLNPETEYEVEVRSKCTDGTPSEYSAAVSFTTNSVEVTYCDSYANYPLANFHISNVSLNTINNTSTESGYSDFTNISTDLAAGATYTISLTTGSDADYPAYYAVWIDYNNNGTFEATERVFSIATTADVVATGSFTLPSDVNPITTRMRVSLSNSPGIPAPCENINIGEVEDYTINLVPAPACAAPTNLNLVQVTATSVIINWTAGGTESRWVVSYGTPGYTPGDSNEISLLNANSPGGQISGLNANTQYDLYVRANCEPGLSEYVGPLSFTTLSALVNDDLCDALPLTLGASSAGDAYTNVGATAQANEPQGSCAYGTIMSVWFSFEAPLTGNATVTTDIAGGSLNDTEVTIYEAPTDCADLLTLGAEIACDQDGGGTTGHNWRSIATMTGLTPGNTYYIQVDGYGSSTGTFGIEVHDDGYDGFVYENGTWSPQNPSGVATTADDIYVINGTTSLTANTGVNNLTIMSGATLEINNVLTLGGDITNDGNLVFASSDSGNGELAEVSGTSNISGNVTVERYMKNKRSYRMVSSAVTTTSSIHDNWQEGATSSSDNPAPGFGTHITGTTTDQMNGFDATATGNASMFTVNVATQQFEAIGNTNVNTLTAGEGYLLFVRGDRSIDLTDPSDNVSSSTVLRATGSLVIGTNTQSFADASANNFVMFGNPYQSAVDINSVFAASTNVAPGFYYVYDPSLGTYGSYVTVDLSDGSNTAGSSANQYLQPGQAAQVKVTGPATVVFNESAKAPGMYTSTSANPMAANDMLTVQLYTTENFNNGGPVHDSFGIVFAEGNDNRITAADATKPMNFYENLGVNNNGTYLSIEHREMPEAGDEYGLYSAGYTKAEYTLKVVVDGLEANDFYLADHFTGTRILLEAGENSYNFKVDANEPMSIATDRFSIYTEQRLGVDDNNLLSGIRLYPNPLNGDTFYINAPKLNGEQLSVSISDVAGRSIYEQTLDCRANTVTVPMGDNIASGVYLVTLKHGGETYTYRLIKE